VNGVLQAGDTAIEFTFEAANGKSISLSDFRGKNVILFFYPKDDTPGCTKEACDFRDSFHSFSDLNTVIIGVSRDPISSHKKFTTKYQLPFFLVSDTNGDVCQKYGVLKEKNMFGKTSIGIERTTFVLDTNGTIVKVYPKVKVKDHVTKVFQFVKEQLTK
jgi:thioredoxin-dependent peroxiredoxin